MERESDALDRLKYKEKLVILLIKNILNIKRLIYSFLFDMAHLGLGVLWTGIHHSREVGKSEPWKVRLD